jgi:predicted metal-dependent hydrolase
MPAPLIVIAGDPAWEGQAEALLRASGFDVVRHGSPDTPERYLEQLTDWVAALILVNGDRPDWRFWTTTPKQQQETRRIPVWVVASDPVLESPARAAGADGFLAVAELEDRLVRCVRESARMPDAVQIARLAEECAKTLPPRARLGIAKFNAGEYYAQHDLFEALWMEEPGPVRDLYRAILQVGIAYYHITRGNHRGALRMLLRSVQWLARLPDVCQGVDVRQLREDAERVRAALQALDPAQIASFDRALLSPVRVVEPAE